MRVTPDDVSELREYLVRVRDLLPRLSLETQVGGGATAGQLAFHTGESADHWIRLRILGDERPRDRPSEFRGSPTVEAISAALDRALDACDELARRQPELGEPGPGAPGDRPGMTVLQMLVHATAHTAEHTGHLEATQG